LENGARWPDRRIRLRGAVAIGRTATSSSVSFDTDAVALVTLLIAHYLSRSAR